MLYINQQDHHPNHEKNSPLNYLNALPPNDISKRYYNGDQKFKSSFWTRCKMFLNIDSYLSELTNFYPYNTEIKASRNSYLSNYRCALEEGFTVSLALVFAIYQAGRRGKVLPVFKQYGTYFKTHRVFRQYLFALIVPPVLFTDYQNWSALDKTETLWATHSRRMNAKMTTDPTGSFYPESELPDDWRQVWKPEYVSLLDRDVMKQNEQQIFQSNYEGEEFETVDLGGGEDGQAEQEE